MFGRGRRDLSVDVLRCLSCFMVCIIHATRISVDYGINDLGQNEWLHNEVYTTLAASPTVLFVMVSGIFFLSPERNVRISRVWRKNVAKMVAAYIFWCAIYAAYSIYITDPMPDVTVEYFIQQFMIQPGHLWYIPMIVGLYIISPILRPITATGDTKLFKYIVCIFIGGMLLWTVYSWPLIPDESYTKVIIDRTPMNLICQFPFWMLFGWIAYMYRPKKGVRYLIYALGIIAILAGIQANIHLWESVEDTYYTAVTQKFSIMTFLKNTAIFYFVLTVFRDHKFSKFGELLLKKISEYTLIIYLVHLLILLIMYNNNFLYDQGFSPWLGVWIYGAIAYVGGGALALVFHLFWDPIKKTLLSTNKK